MFNAIYAFAILQKFNKNITKLLLKNLHLLSELSFFDIKNWRSGIS